VDIAGIMLLLRRIGVQNKWVMPGERLVFYETFINMVKTKSRISELQLGLAVASRKMPSHPLEDAVLLFKLLKRGRLR
jgi:hypothetical protein